MTTLMMKYLTSTAGVSCILATALWGSQPALAVSSPSVALDGMGMWQGLASPLLAQTASRQGTSGISPRSQTPPARVPEPGTLAGLAVIAGSFTIARRRQHKNEASNLSE